MVDIVREIDAVEREVGGGRLDGAEARTVVLRRQYEAPVDDVWDALTTPERISRWFLPVSGDYRIGGRFQFEGNAGGEILACDRPQRLQVSWGGTPVGGRAPADARRRRLDVAELEHTAVVPDEMWTQFGPGAVGVGWEGGLLGLALHLQGGSIGDPMAWQLSDEGRAFFARSSQAWGTANVAAGADPDAAASAVANTTAFYAPDPDAPA